MKATFYIIILGTFLFSCNKSNTTNDMNITSSQIDGLKKELQNLHAIRTGNIIFGHRSVGANIMNGINRLNRDIPDLGVSVADQDSMLEQDSAVLFHYSNGQNSFPYSKIDSFYATLSKHHMHTKVAFFKFCYVDITHKTDIKKLFAYYKETISRIEENYPSVELIHFTVPLNVKSKGWKGLVKSLINRDNNQKREAFNDLIRHEYTDVQLFDLAKYESDYNADSFEKSFTGTRALRPDLTSDGGHLNEFGEEFIGALLLIKINSVMEGNS